MSSSNTFPFWGAGTSNNIAKRQVQQGVPNAYIAWWGGLTGDIWHVAAAQILSQYDKPGSSSHPFPTVNIQTCLTTMNYQDSAETIKRTRGSWEYMNSIGLSTSLVIVPYKRGRKIIATANEDLTHAIAEKNFLEQLSTKAKGKSFSFASVLKELREKGNPGPGPDQEPEEDELLGPVKDPKLVHIWCSTSIVMQMMNYLGFRQSQKILGYHLSGGSQMPQGVKTAAEGKFLDLCATINAQCTPKTKGVVLFNYRIGDVNTQHDANMNIFTQVRELCRARGYLLFAIPQMKSDKWNKIPAAEKPAGAEIFDLLNVVSSPANNPNGTSGGPTDNRAKAYFWHLVATYLQGTSESAPLGKPETASNLAKLDIPRYFLRFKEAPVIGLIGGRSGSTDLPAFVGLRVFSWEEPLLKTHKAWSRPQSIESQGPQVGRLLNQHPLVVTGFLDPGSFQEVTVGKTVRRVHNRLEDSDENGGVLKKWLSNADQLTGITRPLLPARVKVTQNKDFVKTLLQEHGIKNIEKTGWDAKQRFMKPDDQRKYDSAYRASPHIQVKSLKDDWLADVL
ncbi:hypothetical protein QBC44DRAFT_375316 [Cladorrhinum sp. PSN332]|nr:hypothetical protein QBC44DRAFT_375316 [Cladorrhinum sp. PSN332]